ncbi:MAG: serine protease [Deltaproteobacteria bacterium]|nr:serine protease [Deltaproteobacteria bacterium]
MTFVWLLVVMAEPLWAQPANPLNEMTQKRRELAAKMEAATVWILGLDVDKVKMGSGFVIGPNHIMTNAHVVQGLSGRATIFVLNQNLPVTEAELIAYELDKRNNAQNMGGSDFALLQFNPPKSVKLPVLNFNLEVQKMDLIGAWGYPDAMVQFDKSRNSLVEGDGIEAPPVVYTEGTVNTIVETNLGRVIMHSANVTSGNSGGPLVNIAGEVVGINTWRYADKEGHDLAVLNLALSAQDIYTFLVENGVQPQLAAGQSTASLRGSDPNRSNNSPGRKSVKPKVPEEDRTRYFNSFSLKVPEKWLVLDSDEDSVVLASNDQKTSLGVVVAPNKGLGAWYWSKVYAEKFGSVEPDEYGEDIFVIFPKDEDDTLVIVGDLDEARHMVIYLNGNLDDPMIDVLLDSIEGI